ncbi:hypothetical protein EZU65_00335 [Escherichia coli]|nr:hypothetical protein [Escherichia coli]
MAIVNSLKTASMMKDYSLARATGDAGWHGFIIKVVYKAAEKGAHLENLNSSLKTCHCCSYRMPEIQLHKRIRRCTDCDTVHKRDIKAALNIG